MDETPATTTAPAARDEAPQRGGIKDTIESILIAFILAFIFRAFVVEAFVIPTGSMAPTLLGAHVRYACEDCGWSYDVNVTSPTSQTSDDPQVPSYIQGDYHSICPNCGYINIARNPPVRYGDRILVLKYLDVLKQFGLVEHPRRWDVVVFKTPFKAPYQQNYIKRLVGLPGESVLILDGDVYTAPGPGADIADFRIQRKHREAQNVLWRIVYDNDHLPRGLGDNRPAGHVTDGWTQPWKIRGGEGWNLGTPDAPSREFVFDGAGKRGTIHFDRNANRPADPRFGNSPLTDWLAYDVNDQGYQSAPHAFVSDLKLELFYERQSGAGPLELRLTKRDDTFTAELTAGRARLIRRGADGVEATLGERAIDLPVGRAVHVEFSNYDYRVELRIDGQAVLATSDEQYAPDPQALLREFRLGQASPPPTIEIAAADQVARVRHLSLWRDIHYINTALRDPLWASPEDFPEHVIHLGPEDFFVLGDNSPISLDARFWGHEIRLPDERLEVPPGRVPKRFMLGKAFFVYWPAGYTFIHQGPSLVPNFGEMRFIH